jgi:pyridoxamine 5'-phosphate oxidase
VFFTNYTSRKGRQLQAHPGASLLFPWYDLERQVSVSGTVRKVAAAESAAYFRSRPYGSRIGAWTSRQSEVIGSRDGLEQRYAELLRRWPDGPPPGLPDAVPVPDFWGGFRLVPDAVEFWQGRPSRLHDRLRYVRSSVAGAPAGAPAGVADGAGAGAWRVERLSP